MAIRKSANAPTSGSCGIRHDCADGGDCASYAARGAERVARQQLDQGLEKEASAGRGARGRPEEAGTMRRKWTNKIGKKRKNYRYEDI